MKKLFTLLSFCFLFSLSGLTQEIIKSFACEHGTWSDYRKTFLWDDLKKCNITFLIQGNVIVADDYAKSTYTLLNLVIDDGEVLTWEAIDENGTQCMITLAVVNDTRCLIVIYSDNCFRYYF